MFEIKANPLRVSTTVFTVIIILLMLLRKVLPSDYTVHINDSLNNDISGNPVTLQKIRTILQNQDKNIQLIDIRTPEEFNEGHLQFAINIPTENLLDRKSRKLMKKKQNVIYCSTESMAHSAAFLLRQCGFDCKPVNGNYMIIREKVIEQHDPSFGFYHDEKQQFNYPAFIKHQETPAEFMVDKKEEVKIQSGC
jgi:rhodanese-related sulfurtransferase